MFAGSGANIDKPVSCFYGFLVMLDDYQGIAQITQIMQGMDQPLIIALMEADRRLIQDIHDPYQA